MLRLCGINRTAELETADEYEADSTGKQASDVNCDKQLDIVEQVRYRSNFDKLVAIF